LHCLVLTESWQSLTDKTRALVDLGKALLLESYGADEGVIDLFEVRPS
jgi:hypothetical protein